MIEERDFDAAVTAGVIDSATRTRLIDFVRAHRRGEVGPDEEQFRLLTGFNDIFVTIASGLVLVAIAMLAGATSPFAGALGIAGASWLLAEYFTRTKRMALPSIILLLTFVGGAFFAALALTTGAVTVAFGGQHAAPSGTRDCRHCRGRGCVGALAAIPCPDHDCCWRGSGYRPCYRGVAVAGRRFR